MARAPQPPPSAAAAATQPAGREPRPDLRASRASGPGSADERGGERVRGPGPGPRPVPERGGGGLGRRRCRRRWPRGARRGRGGGRTRPTRGGMRGSGRPAGGSTRRRGARRPRRRKMRRGGGRGTLRRRWTRGRWWSWRRNGRRERGTGCPRGRRTPWSPARGTGARRSRRQWGTPVVVRSEMVFGRTPCFVGILFSARNRKIEKNSCKYAEV